jgi:O-antigen/teichoic acid export membrane protein
MRDGEARGPIEPALAGGAALGLLAVALEKVTALGIALYLPRHLGLEDYGRYALLMSYLGLFQGLADASLEAVLVTRLARAASPAAVADAALSSPRRLLAGALTALLTLANRHRRRRVGARGRDRGGRVRGWAANPYRLVLRARLALGRYLGLVAGQAVLGVVLLALVVREGGGPRRGLRRAAAGRARRPRPRGGARADGIAIAMDGALGRALLRDAWPLAGTTAALTARSRRWSSSSCARTARAPVGLLGGAQRLIDAIALVPQALMVSVLPSLSLAAAEPRAATARAREAARVLAVIIVPLVAALLGVGGAGARVRLGASFVAGASTLRWLAGLALVGATGTVTTNLLLALGMQRILLRVAIAAALAIVIAGMLVVPGGGGAGRRGGAPHDVGRRAGRAPRAARPPGRTSRRCWRRRCGRRSSARWPPPWRSRAMPPGRPWPGFLSPMPRSSWSPDRHGRRRRALAGTVRMQAFSPGHAPVVPVRRRARTIVVIPTYNERENVPRLVPQVLAQAPRSRGRDRGRPVARRHRGDRRRPRPAGPARASPSRGPAARGSAPPTRTASPGRSRTGRTSSSRWTRTSRTRPR